jgi:hypothetical protein
MRTWSVWALAVAFTCGLSLVGGVSNGSADESDLALSVNTTTTATLRSVSISVVNKGSQPFSGGTGQILGSLGGKRFVLAVIVPALTGGEARPLANLSVPKRITLSINKGLFKVDANKGLFQVRAAPLPESTTAAPHPGATIGCAWPRCFDRTPDFHPDALAWLGR